MICSFLSFSSLNQVEFDDSGQYQCYVHTNEGTVNSDMVTISVVGPPHIDNDADMANISVNVGDDLNVEVYFCSRPPARKDRCVNVSCHN